LLPLSLWDLLEPGLLLQVPLGGWYQRCVNDAGVIQMLSPQPGGLARKESPDNKASYAFGGVTNTASQGYPVGLLYGKRRIGGAIISAGIYVEDQQ
jgi:predicted phage tail protein